MTKHQHEPEPTPAEVVPSTTPVIEEYPRQMFKATLPPAPVEAAPVPVVSYAVAQTAEEQAALEADGYHAEEGAAIAHADGATVASPAPAPEPRRHYNER